MPKPPGVTDHRRADIARIHIYAQQLDMADDTYRALLLRITGQQSCTAIDASGRAAVIAEMLRLGATDKSPQRAQRGKPKGLDRSPYLRKIGALLADAGRPWEYAHALARRMCRVDRLQFAREADLRKIVAALAIDAQRQRARKSGAGTHE